MFIFRYLKNSPSTSGFGGKEPEAQLGREIKELSNISASPESALKIPERDLNSDDDVLQPEGTLECSEDQKLLMIRQLHQSYIRCNSDDQYINMYAKHFEFSVPELKLETEAPMEKESTDTDDSNQ